ncbi:MAG: Hsp20/alpha crystallin family protein [Schleiferilactobacillus perolens]|jgi:HSP20 family protein|uniref:Hsp20/alpha crystallin family protein n=1 Tax=Schleiferilactobacillus perolens TaxID=100468 RepID=UPI0039EA4F85|nr:Hsp20/alpha crystallin family protein [Schleiferilactobacillus harbinensis]MCI1912828.1 Hsp20/alpha crystallin family protein [Schleiferilactobacillus harbinensis]
MATDMMTRRNNALMNDTFFDNLARRFFNPVVGDWEEPSISSTAVNGLLTDVKETKNAYITRVDIPGVDKNDIKLNYHDNVLSINVSKNDVEDHADKDGNVLMSERSSGTMSRSYQLPNVDVKNIKANFDKGVLTITLPKLTESKELGRSIEIQ